MLLVSCDRKPGYPQLRFEGQQVAVDTRTLKESVPEFYSVVIDGKRVDFFIIRTAGGVAAYFDACKECYRKKRGYLHDDGTMVCRACDVRFPCDRLDTGIGGCYPVRVPGTAEGDTYILTREALAAGLKYF